MSDLSSLLTQYSAATPLPARGSAADDLARGRRALRRQRALRVGSPTGLLALAVAAAVTVVPQVGTSPSPNTGAARGSAVITQTSTIALVSYDGVQLGEYTIDSVPDGWSVQTATNGELTIAPVGMPVTDNYLGKILVTRQSKDVAMPTHGIDVAIGSAHGVVTDTADRDGSRFLSYVDPATGFMIQIQVPPVLRAWTAQQLAQFATGVHVPATAEGTAG